MDFADVVDSCAMAATLGRVVPAEKWVEGLDGGPGVASFGVLL